MIQQCNLLTSPKSLGPCSAKVRNVGHVASLFRRKHLSNELLAVRLRRPTFQNIVAATEWFVFCTECGSKNPEDFRFCASCGQPRAVPGGVPIPAVTGAASAGGEVSALARELKDVYLNAATVYVRRGSTGTPFSGLEDSGLITRALTQELTPPDLAHLTRLDWDDPRINDLGARADESIDIWFTYLQMLRFLGEALNDKDAGLGQGLVEAAFEARAMLYFGSTLDAFVEKKEWAEYDDITEQYVEEAEGAGPFQEMRAAVRAAHAKLMVGDRRAAKAHAERVPSLAAAARAGKYYYTVMSPDLAREWIVKWESDARQLLLTL